MPVRVRFAPSPTGLLHVGNVRTALFNWLFARQSEGTFILRIENTDRERSESRFESYLQEDLRWLGLTWDEGPDIGGDFAPYRQLDGFDLYGRAAEALLEQGKAYYCFCSQEELAEVRRQQLSGGLSPRYPGTCRSLDPEVSSRRVEGGESATVRFRVGEGEVCFRDAVFGDLRVDRGEIGDFILLRSDGSAQYNLAVVMDDVRMRISHVIRGEGHIPNTYRQILLYEALGKKPPAFAHLSTILGPDGGKLSKRHGATSIRDLREKGYLPQALVNYLALLGWTPEDDGRELLTLPDLVSLFRLDQVHRAPAVFDETKLKWMNRHYLKELDAESLVSLLLPHLSRTGWVDRDPTPPIRAWLSEIAGLLLNYLDTADDIVAAAGIIFDFDPERDMTEEELSTLREDETARRVVVEFESSLLKAGEVSPEGMAAVLEQVKERAQVKGKALFHPIRLALTGQSSGPDLKTLVPLIEAGSRLALGRPIPGVAERIRRSLSEAA